MIDGLKPYPAMKDSGVPWLGEVPEHWEVRRLKHVCRMVYGDALAAEARRDGAVAVYGSNGRVGFHSIPNTAAPCIVIGRKGSFGKVNFSAEPVFAIDTAYFVDARTTSADIRWLYYLLGWLRLDEVSKDSAIPGLDREDTYQRFAPVPSFAEQAAIVRFLDYMNRRIRRYIRAKQKLIKLLEEQKQAIIHRAVTRGLDPDVRLKPSGVEWLGDVPEHWEVRRLKTICTMRSGDGITALEIEPVGDYPVFGGNGTRGFTTRYTHEGDFVLIGRQGALCGNVHIASGRFWASEHAVVTTPRQGVRPQWLAALLGVMNLNQYSVAAAQPGLAVDRILNLFVPIPPQGDQELILRHITFATSKLVDAASRASHEIALVRECGTRLIADVVTGKLDVREVVLTDQANPAAHRPAPKANIHFRRAVLGAEIIHRLHKEPTFGHVKFEKLIFLCEKRCGIDTGSKYQRQAAGPYDNRALHSIDSQIKKNKWYDSRKGTGGYRYVPLEKAGGHSSYFARYFGDVSAQFDEVIGTFRKATTIQCELVATLYAAWEDLLRQGIVTDNDIIHEVLHNWHPSKSRIPESRWRAALEWMKAADLRPRAAEA